MTDFNVTDQVNTDLREYALYTINERAIPSFVDGFKPVQRKAIYTALQTCRNKDIKTVALTGFTYPLACYHHGDNSMTNAIIGLTAEHSNNVSLLKGNGAFGSPFGLGIFSTICSRITSTP